MARSPLYIWPFLLALSDFTGAFLVTGTCVVSVSLSVNSVITLPLRSTGLSVRAQRGSWALVHEKSPSFGFLKKAEV